MKSPTSADLNSQQIADTPRSVSFSRCLELAKAQSATLRETGRRAPNYVLSSKLIAHGFARQLGLNVPPILAAGLTPDDLIFAPGTVTKPTADGQANGVYVTGEDGVTTYLRNHKTFATPAEARRHAKRLMEIGKVKSRQWMVEGLIQGPEGGLARDVKFYCFYGDIGLVLESQRLPDLRRCWYNPAGQQVQTGKYDDSGFDGGGDFGAALAVAQRISLAIPAAFQRVDLMISGEKIYFGEVTPMPSGHRLFNEFWDRQLGGRYIRATTRLAYDIAEGKSFDTFAALNRDEAEICRRMNAGEMR